MATVLCLLRFGLLFSYFAIRYIVDIILQTFGLLTFENDASAYFVIDLLVTLIRVSLHLFQLISRSKRALVILASVGIILPSTRDKIVSVCSWRNVTWLMVLKLIARNSKKRQIWLVLSSFITFTRLSSGRGYLEKNCSNVKSLGRGYSLALVLVPRLIRLGLLYLLLRCLLPLSSATTSSVLLPEENAGFTSKIPSCYDGDTCHSELLQYDGQLLPALFRKMNIRILGIDAPELRSAKCDLERCLAERAKWELEQIVGAGSGIQTSLVDCRHDKYGGRLTCDILTNEGRSVAEEMLNTGLAIPYHGKRKTHSWCDEQSHPHPELLRPHILACNWEYMDDEIVEEGDWM